MTPELRAVLEALEPIVQSERDISVPVDPVKAARWNRLLRAVAQALLADTCAAALAAPDCVCAETSIRNCPVHGQDAPPGVAEVEAESVGSLRDDAAVSFRRADPPAPARDAELDNLLMEALPWLGMHCRDDRSILGNPLTCSMCRDRIDAIHAHVEQQKRAARAELLASGTPLWVATDHNGEWAVCCDMPRPDGNGWRTGRDYGQQMESPTPPGTCRRAVLTILPIPEAPDAHP